MEAPQLYEFSLKAVGLVVGLLLVAVHLFALLRADVTKAFLKQFPRSKFLGIVILSVDAVWGFWLAASMDLGEFTRFRTPLLIAVPICFFLAIYYMEEFLAVRALGILALLAAEPLLSAAFLRPEVARLLVVILAYAWCTAGLFWVGMPYLLRDQISWVTRTALRYRAAVVAGIAYGVALIFCALTFY
jgi:hypothetical protein